MKYTQINKARPNNGCKGYTPSSESEPFISYLLKRCQLIKTLVDVHLPDYRPG